MHIIYPMSKFTHMDVRIVIISEKTVINDIVRCNNGLNRHLLEKQYGWLVQRLCGFRYNIACL